MAYFIQDKWAGLPDIIQLVEQLLKLLHVIIIYAIFPFHYCTFKGVGGEWVLYLWESADTPAPTTTTNTATISGQNCGILLHIFMGYWENHKLKTS